MQKEREDFLLKPDIKTKMLDQIFAEDSKTFESKPLAMPEQSMIKKLLAKQQEKRREPPSEFPINIDEIEESLDSFDFFKVTNLGRINSLPMSQQQPSDQSSKLPNR